MFTYFETFNGGKLPTRATEDSCGYDLYNPEDFYLGPKEQGLVKLGIKWTPSRLSDELDDLGFGGFFAKIWDKSGLAVKQRFNTRAGVIDSDYKDEWGLVCVNEGDVPISFGAGKKIAQFVLLPFLVANDLFTEEVIRSGGFGSTGD